MFTYGAPQLKFGAGAAAEIGYDLGQLGARRALVVTDPGVAATGHPARIADQMAGFGLDARVSTTGCTSSPPTQSLGAAVDWARSHGPWDAFVAVGGGSSIDTAKAVNLHADQPRRADGLRQRAGREGRRAGQPAAAAGRRADHDRHRAPRAPRSACSTCWPSTSRPASATPGCAPRWRSSTRELTM